MTSPGLASFTTTDGLQLSTYHWAPETEARATVLLLHGYAEHCGRYNHVAQAFAEQGAAVYALDQRGHGRSEGPRAYVDKYETYADDLDLFRRWVQAQTPDRPLFLFGHSMGGLTVLLYVLNRAVDVRGVILSAPSIEINPDLAPLLRRVAQVLGRWCPTLPTVRSPQDSISRDPSVVEAAQNDPLNYHGHTKARMGAELLRAGDEAKSRLHELDDPFLVLQGTADPLVSPDWSKRLYHRAAAADKTLRLYDGLYHETFNEPEQDTVLSDLGRWLAARLPTTPAP